MEKIDALWEQLNIFEKQDFFKRHEEEVAEMADDTILPKFSSKQLLSQIMKNKEELEIEDFVPFFKWLNKEFETDELIDALDIAVDDLEEYLNDSNESWQVEKQYQEHIEMKAKDATVKRLVGSDVLKFGKYKGKTIAEIFASHPDYLEWAEKNIDTFAVDWTDLEKK